MLEVEEEAKVAMLCVVPLMTLSWAVVKQPSNLITTRLAPVVPAAVTAAEVAPIKLL